jgi:DNA-binding MarR family transcriptional regulator
MTTPFGPRLVGETEKTLVALLHRFLDGTGLTEPQWVTLRVVGMLDGSTVDREELAAVVADRAHFPDAAELVDSLTARGLIEDARLSDAGRELVAAVLAKSEAATGQIWKDLPADDVAATTRVLNELIDRARVVLR